MNNDQFCFVSNEIDEDDLSFTFFLHLKIGDEDSAWFFLAGTEDGSVFESAENFYQVRLSKVILFQPFVRPYLSGPLDSQFQYDRENGRVLDYTKKRTLTSRGKQAFPLACDVRPSIPKWFWFDPIACLYSFFALCSLIAAPVHHPVWLLAVAFFCLRPTVSWVTFYEHFRYGEAIAGIVVPTSPTLVATEWHRGEGWYPSKRFIGINKFRIRKINSKRIQVGDRIVLANVPKREVMWTFKKKVIQYPIPINKATSDYKKIEAAFSKITPQEWESLEEGIGQLRYPLEKGVFEIEFTELGGADLIEEAEAIYQT